MTPSQLVLTLKGEGIPADLEIRGAPGSNALPTGTLPGGRGWIVADNAGFVRPGQQMPRLLTVQFYQAENENTSGLPFNDPFACIPQVTAEQAINLIRNAAAGDWGAVTAAAGNHAPATAEPVSADQASPLSEAMEAISAAHRDMGRCLITRMAARTRFTDAGLAAFTDWMSRQDSDTILRLHHILDHADDTCPR